MIRLLEFLYKRKLFGLFLLLEAVSFWLLFSFNNRYNTYYLNSSNRIVGQVNAQMTSISNYFDLTDINRDLALENAELRNLLARKIGRPDSTSIISDSVRYLYHVGEVVNSNHLRAKNFITVKMNPTDNIKPGMGVITSEGIAGVVKSVSRHFATVTSILSPKLMISARVKENGAICTVQWDGNNPLFASLKFVPIHLDLQQGDTIVTSGFDAIFPNGHMIGVVSESERRDESPFYEAKIRLGTDFTKIRTTYIVETFLKSEQKELEGGLE